MKMSKKIGRDRFTLYVGRLSLEIYWPTVRWGPIGKYENAERIYFIAFPTLVTYRPAQDWKWHNAGAIKVLGFGVGYAWKHCDNPTTPEPTDDN